jgi:predicted SAM-dependent methyltransferase
MNFDLIKSVINQETNKITIRGVIHIGPIDNDIIAFYKQQNINNILILEPNSFIYQSIQNYSIDPTITIANCLPSNENSTKTISFIHPSHIDKITSQEVTTRTIEQVIIDIKHNLYNYNAIITNTHLIDQNYLLGLKNIINNFSLIYIDNSNSPFSIMFNEEITSLLSSNHLTNVSTDKGVLIYVPTNIIQCSTLGINGRFANQVFQHFFLHTYAQSHDLKPENHTWIGQTLFDIKDNPITQNLEQITIPNDILTQDQPDLPDLSNKDVFGWFQFNMSYYKQYQSYIQSTYQIKEPTHSQIENAYNTIFNNKTVIAIHLRLQDYGHDNFFITPISYYLDWLDKYFDTFDNPVLYIATDDRSVLSHFAKYNPYTDKSYQLIITQVNYILDFYTLTHSDVLLISNSSFSFLASLLNKSYQHTYRPSIEHASLIQYNPWTSDPILHVPKDYKHLPINQTSLRKLHIGGTTHHPDWEVLNIQNLPTTNYIGNAENLYQFEDNTFETIYASHILEHFDYHNILSVLLEWNRVLINHGKLYLSIPDFKTISELINKKYANNLKAQIDLMRMVFGGHIDKNDYHMFLYTRPMIKEILLNAGFDQITFLKKLDIFDDTSSMRYDNTLISLNLSATKIRHLNQETQETQEIIQDV